MFLHVSKNNPSDFKQEYCELNNKTDSLLIKWEVGQATKKVLHRYKDVKKEANKRTDKFKSTEKGISWVPKKLETT